MKRTFQKSALHAAMAAALTLGMGAAQATEIKLMTGPQGGAWYPLGGAIQNLIQSKVAGTKVQVLPGAGISNVKGVEASKADLGFGNAVSTVDGVKALRPLTRPPRTSATLARSISNTSR